MDVAIRRYKTFADLRVYCERVASAVGLASIEIFGYTNPQTRRYAVELGVALQLTNILRDIGADAARGRLYIPLDELQHFRWRRSRSSAPSTASTTRSSGCCSATRRSARASTTSRRRRCSRRRTAGAWSPRR